MRPWPCARGRSFAAARWRRRLLALAVSRGLALRAATPHPFAACSSRPQFQKELHVASVNVGLLGRYLHDTTDHVSAFCAALESLGGASGALQAKLRAPPASLGKGGAAMVLARLAQALADIGTFHQILQCSLEQAVGARLRAGAGARSASHCAAFTAAPQRRSTHTRRPARAPHFHSEPLTRRAGR